MVVGVGNEGKGFNVEEGGGARKSGGSRRSNSSVNIPTRAVEEEAVVAGSDLDTTTKSTSPHEAKAVLNPDEGNSSSDDGGSGGSSGGGGSRDNYLGKVGRKQHKRLKRSLGSGFELVELSQLTNPDHPHHCILQLGCCPLDPTGTITSGSGSAHSPRGSGHSSGASSRCSSKHSLSPTTASTAATTLSIATSRESLGSASSGSIVLAGAGAGGVYGDDELPPEEHWRDGLLGGFCCGGSFCSIGLPSLCCTAAALLRVVRALGWHPGRGRQLLALATTALLWLTVPLATYLRLYPVAAAALLLVLALEAAAACRLRQIVRRRFSVDGSACQDGALSCLFTPCVAAQMLRHLRTGPAAAAAVPSSGASCTHVSVVA